ncbi:hypothetical protein [Candidatus Leptofilum sp.]|uniref:hypothetical protein n=1 Tax=Candidatus Leptofilum sp. TaxID=3241576 RepID=UPI003B5C89CD
MGIFGDVVKGIVGVAVGGPVGGLIAVTKGDEIVEGTVDVVRQIVSIGEDVYRAIPAWAFAFGNPLHGVLKHVAEDEIIMLGQIAGEIVIVSGLYWPVLGPVGATAQIMQNIVPTMVTVGSLIGKIDHRYLNDQEWEMANYIFGDSLADRDRIILTNFSWPGDRPFVFPNTIGQIYVNLGSAYVHNGSIFQAPLLFHELTHVWQAERHILREIFFYHAAVGREYSFEHGRQWSEYNLEQQASIVEAWLLGRIRKAGGVFTGDRNRLAIGSPLFRYINGNIRTSNNFARTMGDSSVRRFLLEGNHQTMRDMHPEPPPLWW